MMLLKISVQCTRRLQAIMLTDLFLFPRVSTPLNLSVVVLLVFQTVFRRQSAAPMIDVSVIKVLTLS